MRATAEAGINIALIKYWGKRDVALNLPAVGSISLTLGELGSRSTVHFDPELKADRFLLNEVERTDGRVFETLDAVRRLVGLRCFARVESHNTVPTAAGLASSASGAAALSTAAWVAAGLPFEPGAAVDARLADITRINSGSGPRSLLGGLVELDRETGRPHQLLAPEAWPLAVVVAMLGRGPKAVSSREGMARSRATSPYFDSWISSHPADLKAARAAIIARDLSGLGTAMEHSTTKMHACMLASKPALRYWRAGTMAALDTVERLRQTGLSVWSTMDAGPHVKVLCGFGDAPAVQIALAETAGVQEVLLTTPGPGVRVL